MTVAVEGTHLRNVRSLFCFALPFTAGVCLCMLLFYSFSLFFCCCSVGLRFYAAVIYCFPPPFLSPTLSPAVHGVGQNARKTPLNQPPIHTHTHTLTLAHSQNNHHRGKITRSLRLTNCTHSLGICFCFFFFFAFAFSRSILAVVVVLSLAPCLLVLLLMLIRSLILFVFALGRKSYEGNVELVSSEYKSTWIGWIKWHIDHADRAQRFEWCDSWRMNGMLK